MKKFAENLKNIRNINGVSQKELASRVGTTQQRVSEWENGQVEPSLFSLIKLIKALNTTFDDLTDGIEI